MIPEVEGAAAAQPPRVAPPSKLWLLVEGRAVGELLTTMALRRWLRRLGRGDGHPVLLLPGFLAGDLSTRPLRQFLRDLGYWAHRWKLGPNLGVRGDLEERMAERVREVYAQHGRRVSLVGWSLGGVYARVLAHRFPELVRSVVSLGAPFAADTKANNSWRLYEWITGARLDELPAQRMAEFRDTPPVPTTSIFSRTDGVAAWQTALQSEEPQAESIQVPGSHLGLGFNPLVLYAIADRLAQEEGKWQPFFRDGATHPPGFRRPPEARVGEPAPDELAHDDLEIRNGGAVDGGAVVDQPAAARSGKAATRTGKAATRHGAPRRPRVAKRTTPRPARRPATRDAS